MKCAVFALLACAAAESSTGGTLKITWQDCGDADTHGKVTDLEPKSVEIGSSSTMTGTGTLDKAETGGTFEIDAKASILKEKYTGNVCEAKTFDLPLGLGHVTWGGMKCPLAAGVMTVPVGFSMASSIPASLASVSISATAKASNGDKLLCLNAQLAKEATETSDVQATAACSDDEIAKISALPKDTSAGSMGGQSATCGKSAYSIFSGFSDDKFNSCLTGAVGISTTCSTCYAKAGEYGAGNCKSKCMFGWCSAGCLSCTAAAQATAATCSGVPAVAVQPCLSEKEEVVV